MSFLSCSPSPQPPYHAWPQGQARQGYPNSAFRGASAPPTEHCLQASNGLGFFGVEGWSGLLQRLGSWVARVLHTIWIYWICCPERPTEDTRFLRCLCFPHCVRTVSACGQSRCRGWGTRTTVGQACLTSVMATELDEGRAQLRA